MLAVLLGTVLSVALIVGTESVMRAFDLGPQQQRDPFAGFSTAVEMFESFEPPEGPAIFRAQRSRDGARREFLAEKPANGLRIFIVGGSSAAGVPYGRDYAFSSFLAERLAEQLPGRHVEVVNAAVSGYASRRVLGVVRELAGYEPDLVIVYAGHNEGGERQFYAHLLDTDPRLFEAWAVLASTRLFALLNDLAGRGSSPLSTGDAADDEAELELIQAPGQLFAKRQNLRETGVPASREHEYTRMHFESNLREIVRSVQDAGGAVLLLSQTQNYADWAPGASQHRAELSAEKRERFASLMASAGRRRKTCEARLVELRRAEQIDATHAQLQFEIANCLREQGHFARARRRYRLASDLDRIPVGAPSSYKEAIERVAHETGSLYLDVELTIDAEAERVSDGLVGFHFVIDAMHPTLHSHQLIAVAVAERLRATDSQIPADQWRDVSTPFASVQQILDGKPELAPLEHQVRGLSCLLLERSQCAVTEAQAVLAARPDDEPARQLLRLAKLQSRGRAKKP